VRVFGESIDSMRVLIARDIISRHILPPRPPRRYREIRRAREIGKKKYVESGKGDLGHCARLYRTCTIPRVAVKSSKSPRGEGELYRPVIDIPRNDTRFRVLSLPGVVKSGNRSSSPLFAVPFDAVKQLVLDSRSQERSEAERETEKEREKSFVSIFLLPKFQNIIFISP